MKSLTAITDLTPDTVVSVLDRADQLRLAWRAGAMPATLTGERIALWFYGNGFRNRLAFELGARSMGAQTYSVPGELGAPEPVEDVGRYLSNWFSMLVIRAKRHSDLLSVAAQVDIPVINARTEFNHPCEILGDLQFIRQRRGSLDGLKVIFVGEASNLCMSWFEAAARLPISVTQMAPPGHELAAERLAQLRAGALGELAVTNDPPNAIRSDTDVIYTDCWPKPEDWPDRPAIRAHFLPYQIDARVLARMNPAGVFLPCPPVTRGEEVSEDAMNSALCMNHAAKEYLLHAQNALMEYCAGVLG